MTEAQAFFPGDRVKFYTRTIGKWGGYAQGIVVGDIFWGFSSYEDDPDTYVCQKFLVVQDGTETVHELSSCQLTHA